MLSEKRFNDMLSAAILHDRICYLVGFGGELAKRFPDIADDITEAVRREARFLYKRKRLIPEPPLRYEVFKAYLEAQKHGKDQGA